MSRTARLVFDDALQAGRITPEDLSDPRIARALKGGTPPAPQRFLQRLAIKRGRLDPERGIRQLEQLRRDVLGPEAATPPRFLVRVDEFPHWLGADRPEQYGTDGFVAFHQLFQDAGVPYLTAIVPQPALSPDDPEETRCRELDAHEREVLARMQADGVALAMHGLDHRTNDTRPRHHAELLGLGDDALAQRLDAGIAKLGELGVQSRILVPPFNRFSAGQWPVMAERFDVITGGPESVRLMGLQSAPAWLGDAVYLPSYEPFYAAAGAIIDAARAAIARQGGVWIPLTLHWGWEADEGFDGLRRLLEVIAPHAAPWEDFLAAVDRSA
ncbi:MAG: DUF2334 domain-containing protein [Solirubrobacteraceae bacterium]|nr:DUF2334 domain-containing protein [Solirubrobacteraceae bacterium]